MKLTSLNESVRYINSVREKSGDQGGQNSGQQQKREGSNQQNSDAEVFAVTDENVNAAIQGFQNDAAAQANGIKAELEGKGPGLRVTLKDGSGAILRHMTGEEFLQMREATKQGQIRGKLLDQKI